MLGSYAIVGAHLPMAAGAAWSAQLRGTGQVAVAFFGDGATNIGAFHEALNLAAVWSLPVLFVCENNLYMEYTPISSVTAVPHPAADRAASYGLAPQVIDGNDVTAEAAAVGQAADRARAGAGPALLEAVTYRHFGHSRTDPAKYRPAEEVEQWLRRDPLTVARGLLAAAGAAPQTVDAAAERARQVVAAAVEEARRAPAADPGQALTDVWADGGAAWRT
jgi:pyruvate dehydrogenase E1 component alpha subunit